MRPIYLVLIENRVSVRVHIIQHNAEYTHLRAHAKFVREHKHLSRR